MGVRAPLSSGRDATPIRRAMRSVAAAALLLAATAAAGGELIHFRGPDGRIGLVDHPSKLPPGAIVVGRRETSERAEEPEPAAPAAEPARARADEGAEETEPVDRPGHWCEQGRSARSRIARAEQALERAEEQLEDCETASLREGGYCTRRWLEGAEQELESAEEALSSLEAACRSAECLPGWLRGDCDG
jgi:hypothetical protein